MGTRNCCMMMVEWCLQTENTKQDVRKHRLFGCGARIKKAKVRDDCDVHESLIGNILEWRQSNWMFWKFFFISLNPKKNCSICEFLFFWKIQNCRCLWRAHPPCAFESSREHAPSGTVRTSYMVHVLLTRKKYKHEERIRPWIFHQCARECRPFVENAQTKFEEDVCSVLCAGV